ncbi:hypothetical protein TNCV_4349261 [Trichonephila clavipes]|nr:hypothetical protein TNCV_4349261 [Trichonephila clavipes]
MLLLRSDDLGSGPRMSKAIHTKGAPTLYSCSLPLDHPVDLFGRSHHFTGPNADVDGVVTWWTTGSITPNFFPTLKLFERFLLLSEQGLLERTSPFSSADLFRLLHTFFDSVTLIGQGSS